MVVTSYRVAPKRTGQERHRLGWWLVTLWIHLISIFVVVNSSTRITTPAAAGCWPAVMATRVSLSFWRFIHAVAATVFAGSIVTTTVVEWNVVRSWYYNNHFHRNNNDNASSSSTSRGADSSSPEEWLLRFWFATAASVEQWLVLPALTLSIVSGVAQAAITYQHLSLAPRYVKSSLHILLLFGLWWGVTDRTTQRTVTQQLWFVSDNHNQDENGSWSTTTTTTTPSPIVMPMPEEKQRSPTNLLGKVLRQRRISNVVSCAFLVALYAVMVLKPGFIRT